jgi:hypothetical protein
LLWPKYFYGFGIPVPVESFETLKEHSYPSLYSQNGQGGEKLPVIVIGALALANHSCDSPISITQQLGGQPYRKKGMRKGKHQRIEKEAEEWEVYHLHARCMKSRKWTTDLDLTINYSHYFSEDYGKSCQCKSCCKVK